MSDEIEYNCEHLNITFTNKAGKLTLLKRYKIFYKTREIRFHFRYPEPNQLCDYEKLPYPNMVFYPNMPYPFMYTTTDIILQK